DATKAKAVPGVKNVVQIPNGVAVIADNTWNAMQGRRVLAIEWDEGKVATVNSPGITADFMSKMSLPGLPSKKVGDAEATLAASARKVESVYEVPFLAHAPMEPLNATADVKPNHCAIYASTQGQSAAQQIAARITGLPPDAI